jgi:hypothetical protein
LTPRITLLTVLILNASLISPPPAYALIEISSLPSVDAKGLAVDGTKIFVSGGFGGLTVVDISNPALPFVEVRRGADYASAEA